MPLGNAPKHPRYFDVLRLWNHGKSPENTPIRAFKTLQNLTGVDRNTLKDWQARGWLDRPRPGGVNAGSLPPGGERADPLGRRLGEDPVSARPDGVHNSSPTPHTSGPHRGVQQPSPVQTDPFFTDGVLTPSADASQATSRAADSAPLYQRTVKIAETALPEFLEITYLDQMPGFYDDAGRWITDHAQNTRRLASLSLAHFEGIVLQGGIGTRAAHQALQASVQLAKQAVALEKQAPALPVDPNLDRQQVAQHRAAIRRRHEETMRAYRNLKTDDTTPKA
jgi:hypothetical protein